MFKLSHTLFQVVTIYAPTKICRVSYNQEFSLFSSSGSYTNDICLQEYETVWKLLGFLQTML